LESSQKQLEKQEEKFEEISPSNKIQEPSTELDSVPAPSYIPEGPPSIIDQSLVKEDRLEFPVDTSKYSKDIAKAVALIQQREVELKTSIDNRNNKKNQIEEETNKLQYNLTKVERKIKTTEEAQQRDISLSKDKEKKVDRKAAKQRIKERILLFPILEDEQISLQIKIEKQQKDGEKILGTMNNEIETFKKQMNKEQESLDKILEKTQKTTRETSQKRTKKINKI